MSRRKIGSLPNTYKGKNKKFSKHKDEIASSTKRKFTTFSMSKVTNDEEISSEEDDDIQSDDEEYDNKQVKSVDHDSDEESVEEKRKRLALKYLNSVMEEDADDDDDSQAENNDENDDLYNNTSSLLKKNRLQSQGKLMSTLSNEFLNLNSNLFTRRNLVVNKPIKGGPMSCVVLSNDNKNIYTGSKDNSIIKWDTETGAKDIIRSCWSRSSDSSNQSHEGEILSIAISTDSSFLVGSGRDKSIHIYDTRQKNSEVHVLTGHRDAVTSVCFQRDSTSLFSGSLDRCIKYWDLREMGYLETLFGHQDGVLAMDCWNNTRPISCSSDRSIRIWKVAEDSHLVYRGHKSSVDAVSYINDEHFISGGQDGSLCLWKDSQKNPVRTVHHAHGFQQTQAMVDSVNPNWISSIATLKMSDIVASGSSDGFVRVWSADVEKKQLKSLINIPVEGFVNGLAITSELVIAATGTEHSLGRWWNLRGNKNKLVVIRFNKNNE
eukprot:gene9286-12513_t